MEQLRQYKIFNSTPAVGSVRGGCTEPETERRESHECHLPLLSNNDAIPWLSSNVNPPNVFTFNSRSDRHKHHTRRESSNVFTFNSRPDRHKHHTRQHPVARADRTALFERNNNQQHNEYTRPHKTRPCQPDPHPRQTATTRACAAAFSHSKSLLYQIASSHFSRSPYSRSQTRSRGCKGEITPSPPPLPP